MAERKWNEKQSEVIKHRGGDLIVSAAAGSGKTAVLVERILGLITDEKEPVDIDDILVVTFTNAAASDMKSKIAKEIDERLSKDPSNGRLSMQSALVQNAIITTIDSFCGYVVKNYFSAIGLEPGYKVGDEEELSILGEEVLDQTMTEFYDSKDKDFRNLVRSYGNAKGDSNVRKMVMKLITNSESHTDPRAWLSSLSDCYDVSSFDEQPWMKELFSLIKDSFANAKAEFERGLEICRMPGGPYHYIENFEADIALMDKLMSASTYSQVYKVISAPKAFTDLSRKRPKDIDDALKEKAKKIRDNAKGMVNEKIRDRFFSVSPSRQKAALKRTKPVVDALSRLAIAYSENLMREKQRRKLYGFSDIEHFALDILTHEQKDADGNTTNPIACAFGRKFKEVMIDEYQDSNDVQETILSRISLASEGHCKRFMVGDVKQSIYGFRLAKPEIFLEKEEEYSDPSNDKKRIVLSKNYRSRAEVLDSTNAVFECIMKRGIAKIDYDDDARLYQGNNDFDLTKAHMMKTELLLGYMDGDAESDEDEDGDDRDDIAEPIRTDKLTFEAMMIADRILKLKALTDDKGNHVFKNNDIAILGRSFKKSGDILLKVLSDAGINAHMTRDTGYFSEPEVKDVISMLEVIDNSRVDIPLYGACVSPFGRMDPAEMAKVRVFARERIVKTGLFDEIKMYISDGADEEIRQKLTVFIDKLDVYRKAAVDTTVRDLIEILLADNGYREYISAMPAGKRRLANIDMLVNIAAGYDENTAGGLFRFVRHIRQMRSYDMDYGEAGNVSEEDDVVRVMTIHKSKGLQFPVVILAGTDTGFSMSDSRAALKCSEKYGAAIRAVDTHKRVKYQNLLSEFIGAMTDKAQRAEEMRVLYVAMTRAEEKLIMVGPIRSADNRPDEADDDRGITDFEAANADSFAKWIEPVARARRDLFDIVEYDVRDVEKNESDRGEKKLADTASVLALGSIPNEFTEEIARRISFRYGHAADVALRQKVSVSEVKKPDYEKQLHEEGADELIKTEKKRYIPKFAASESEESEGHGAAYGTSVHRFMELIDYEALPDSDADFESALKEQMTNICDEGLMEAEAAGSINTGRIAAFLRSDLGRQMRAASLGKTLKREAPFVMEVPATEIYPDIDTTETILVQGIIDAYYIREDGIVVVDYKTDNLTIENDFVEKYHRQLELYGQAISKATQKPVAALYIYSFRLGKAIEIQNRFTKKA